MQPETPNQVVFEELVAQLCGEDEDAAYQAGSKLQKLGDPALRRALQLVHNPHPPVRVMACFVLGQIRDPSELVKEPFEQVKRREGVPLLLVLLATDPNADVRAAAAAALGPQRVPSTLLALCQAAGDPSPDVRFDVTFALGCFYEEYWENSEALQHRQPVVDTLLRLMSDPDGNVRDWATFGIRLGGHDTPDTRAALRRALTDPDRDVVAEAVAALAEFGDRSVVPHLEAALRNPDDLSYHYFEAAEQMGIPVPPEAVGRFAE